MNGGCETTFYTVATAGYFPGTVAVLNSLRLTGNRGELVVFDAGLTSSQRDVLEPYARIVGSAGTIGSPYLAKPVAPSTQATGVAMLIDSDMLVTRSLADVVRLAGHGSICVFGDHRAAQGRWFADWQPTLRLEAPIRRDTYVNSGFVCASVDRFPTFFSRWAELCERAPAEQAFTSVSAPFYAADQDVLNALLRSELSADDVTVLPEAEAVYWDDLRRVEVIDERTLACRSNGAEPALLHYSFRPKPWERNGWARVQRDAYVRLLPRVLLGPDVPLRLDDAELPLWLRPTRAGRALVRGLGAVHAAGRGLVGVTPRPARERLLALRARLYR